MWNSVYTNQFGGMWTPDEEFVRFTARYVQRRVGIDRYDTKRAIQRILDAGCGIGRHVVFFAEQNYIVYGIDISPEAIAIAEEWVTKKQLSAYLQVADIENLPFRDRYFDLVLSHGVLDHMPIENAKKAIKELNRVLVPGGYLFLTLRSVDDSECGRGEAVGYHTYKLAAGYEKGIVQHYFDQDEVFDLLEGFRIFDLELVEQKFPSVYTIDKSYIQSSISEKKFIDSVTPLDLTYSRWYIASEVV